MLLSIFEWKGDEFIAAYLRAVSSFNAIVSQSFVRSSVRFCYGLGPPMSQTQNFPFAIHKILVAMILHLFNEYSCFLWAAFLSLFIALLFITT